MADWDARRRLRELRAQGATAPSRKVAAGESRVSDADVERKAQVDSLQRHARKDDLLECELLEALFTAPYTIEVVRQEIGVDDLEQPLIRELLGVCYDLWDHGERPELGRVLTAVECPHLKRLAVWLDEEAAAHQMADKLAGTADKLAQDAPSAGSHGFLQQVIDGITWRRKRASHETAKGRLAERLDPTTNLDPSLREMLEQSASYHKARATKKLLP
jgi:hypothetical protein